MYPNIDDNTKQKLRITYLQTPEYADEKICIPKTYEGTFKIVCSISFSFYIMPKLICLDKIISRMQKRFIVFQNRPLMGQIKQKQGWITIIILEGFISQSKKLVINMSNKLNLNNPKQRCLFNKCCQLYDKTNADRK